MNDAVFRATPMNPTRLFTALLLCLFLCLAAGACAPVQSIDRKPVTETPADSTDPDAETMTYPEEIAGTVEELYGAGAESELSDTYREAVAENPLLRYIVVYFDFNRAELKPESREILMQHAGYLAQYSQVEVSLEGHADRRGSSGYNLSLGERRALAVRDFLNGQGVQVEQLPVTSYGEERPAVPGDSEEAHARNRRVELVYR